MAKPQAPTPPDPVKTASAQTGENIGTAVANATLNHTNQTGPDGSLTYSQSGTTSWTDPVSGKTYDIPSYTQAQTLSPEQQAIKTQQDQAKLNLSTTAANQTGQIGAMLSKPFEYTTGDHEKWAGNLYDQLNQPKVDQNTEALRSRLSNQGLQEGSAAWDAAMRSNTQGNDNARAQFLLDSQNQGFSQAQATRTEPINEITALLTGGQVSRPQFGATPTTSIPTTDYAGLVGQNYNQQLQNYQAQMSSYGGGLGGLFGIGAALAGNPTVAAKMFA
jgi:hypothetical protein